LKSFGAGKPTAEPQQGKQFLSARRDYFKEWAHKKAPTISARGFAFGIL
jgi:hypothetical protein